MKVMELFEEELLQEMDNIAKEDTGLCTSVWLGPEGRQHGPRIKVSNSKRRHDNSDCFSVTISKNPKVCKDHICKLSTSEKLEIFSWIKLNFKELMILSDLYKSGKLATTITDIHGVVHPRTVEDIILNLRKI